MTRTEQGQSAPGGQEGAAGFSGGANGHVSGSTNGHAKWEMRDEIEARVKKLIDGCVEDCYEETELCRLLAISRQHPNRKQGKALISRITERLLGKYKKDFKPTKFLDLIAAEEEILLNAAREENKIPDEDWRSRLILKPTKDGPGVPAPCVTNALLYFENHYDWTGKLAWDEFSGEPVVLADLPEPINLKAGGQVRDHHDTLMQSWLEQETRDPRWNIDTVRRSVDCWARAHSFHPVKDYLEGLEWDGVERLSSWLTTYCGAGDCGAGADDTAEGVELGDFISAIGIRWWISAIARIFQPGCKVHHVLVLEGAKGIGKTTLAEIIFGEWYAIIHGDVSSKDNQALLSAGVWGVVMDELDVLGKSEMRSIKSWVTEEFQKFRPTWGHRHEKRPRQCVFIANVNGDDWALEEDRRWWPVACHGDFDLAGLRANRDLLMAEALHRYRSGERWHFDKDEDSALIKTAKKEQAARVPENVSDVAFVRVARSVAKFKGSDLDVSVDEIMNSLNVPVGTERNRQAGGCGKALVAAGWGRYRVRVDGVQRVRYRKPFEEAGNEDDTGD